MGCRLVLHILSGVILTGGLALCATSLFTTRWQNLIAEPLISKTFGLYEGCHKTVVQNVKGGWVCTYYNFEGLTPESIIDTGFKQNLYNSGHVESWRVATLILLVSGILIGLVALILCLSACTGRSLRCLGISWTVGAIVAALLTVAAVAIFAKNAHEYANRFVDLPQQLAPVEVSLSWSFHLAIAGAVAILISAVLAVVTLVVIFSADETVVQHKYQYQQVQRNSAV